MGNQHRSIAYRLRKARAMETKQEILRDWLRNFDREINGIINDLGGAVANEDFDRQSQCVGELRAVFKKRRDGLESIFKILTEEEK